MQYTINDANGLNIVKIALHFVESNLSLRKFANEYCGFSYVTLREKLLDNLPLINEEVGLLVSAVLSKRTARNIIDDEEGKIRVLKAANYLLEQDLTVEEIANVLESTVMTIYRDLTVRLQRLPTVDVTFKKAVLLKLREHSLENLVTKGGRS